MTNVKLNVDGIMLFEQPFARVGLYPRLYRTLVTDGFLKIPCENYRRIFRLSQKNIERELGAVQTASKDLAKSAQDINKEDAAKSVDGMITRIENLKRKASQHIDDCLPTS